MKEHMTTNLPNTDEVAFAGETYPLSPVKQAISQLCSFAFITTLILAFVGDKLPMSVPQQLLSFVQERKAMVVGAGFVLNLLGSNLAQSGAFEVFIDDTLVWSKLERGEVPTIPILKKIIIEHTLLRDYAPPPPASADTKTA